MNKQSSHWLLCILLATACQNTTPPPQTLALNTPKKMTYKIINAPNKTFGYDIYVDSKMVIHQPHIPAVAGVEGFKSKSHAIKVANLVIQKMQNGAMPPTLTLEEVK
jgi:hypothetical protein